MDDPKQRFLSSPSSFLLGGSSSTLRPWPMSSPFSASHPTFSVLQQQLIPLTTRLKRQTWRRLLRRFVGDEQPTRWSLCFWALASTFVGLRTSCIALALSLPIAALTRRESSPGQTPVQRKYSFCTRQKLIMERWMKLRKGALRRRLSSSLKP